MWTSWSTPTSTPPSTRSTGPGAPPTCAPRRQFCHIDDLLSALELAIAGEVAGTFAVGCDGWLEQDEVERISGLRRIELPAGLTFGTAQRLHRVGINPAPVNELQYLVYP